MALTARALREMSVICGGLVPCERLAPEQLKLSVMCKMTEPGVRSVHGLHGVLGASISLLAGEEGLAVLIETKVGDLDVAGVHGHLGLLTVSLLLGELFNMNAPSATVNFSDFAFTTLEGAADNFDGVTVADGDAAAEPLGGQVLAELRRHNLSAEGGGGSEVGLAGLSALAGHVCG